MGQPKPSNIVSLYSQLRSYYYAQMLTRMAERNSMYHQQYDELFNFDYDVQIFKSSAPTMIVNGFKNQVRTDEPTVTFNPAGPSKAALEESELMTLWGYGQMEMGSRSSAIDPDAQSVFDLLLRGASVQKVMVDVDRVPLRPVSKSKVKLAEWAGRVKNSWPFVVRSLDPMTVFPAPGLVKPLRYVVEYQQRQVMDIWEDFPDWTDPRSKDVSEQERTNPMRPVNWIEYWSDDYYIVAIDGQIVVDKPNPYGFVPYVYEFSGQGRLDRSGDPSHLAVSILDPIMGEIEALVRLKTAFSVGAMMHVFPVILTTEDARQTARKFGVGPAKVIQYPPGQPPEYMKAPEPNENILLFLKNIEETIGQIQSAAMTGGREPGVDVASLQGLQVGQALTTIKDVKIALNKMATERLNMMARMMGVLDLSMTVEGHGEKAERERVVHGSDFKHFNFNVQFEAVDPAENDRRMMIGQAVRRAGDISQRTFMVKFMKHIVEDIDQEQAEIWAEKILDQMAASGTLGQVVLGQTGQGQAPNEPVTQNRVQDTVPEIAQTLASQMENISGSPGSQTVPRAVTEQAMAGGLAR